jgi:flagellar basal-body rod modification protein FlgD
MMTNLASPSAASAAANAAAVAASTTATTKSSSAGSGSAASLTQADFLQLLTAQLKYQSPSNPADPTQMASEFAAVSTVEGINGLNTKLSALSTSTGAAQMAQAAALVGKQVAVSGNSLTAASNGDAAGAFSLAGPSASTTVTVTNPDGSIAGTLALGPLSAGQQSFNYTGGTAGTNYSYNVTALDSTGAPVSVAPYSVYTVQGVNLSGSVPTLNVAGYAGVLPVSSVTTVLGASS